MLAEHIDELTIDDDKVRLVLRLWPSEAHELAALLELVQALRTRADEAIRAAAGDDGTLQTHPEVKAFRAQTIAREAKARRTTAIAAALFFGIPIAVIAYLLLTH